MRVSEYLVNFTNGETTTWSYVREELVELWHEVCTGNFRGMLEEFGDVVHHIQLYLYERFGWNHRLWKWCSNKYIRRQIVWQQLYNFAGIPHRACYGGNYLRREKVVKQLGRYGVHPILAAAAWRSICGGKD